MKKHMELIYNIANCIYTAYNSTSCIIFCPFFYNRYTNITIVQDKFRK